jgi:predicted hydrocarbon binding protein
LEEAAKSFGPMMMLMYNAIGDLSSAFYKKYGKDALPTIAAVSGKYGADSAKIVQKMMPVKNMKDVAEMEKMMMSMAGEKMEIVKVSDDVFHFKMSHCPLGIQGTNQELCEALMNSDKKMVSTLLGQQINIKVQKSVAAGDKYCEVIYSKK